MPRFTITKNGHTVRQIDALGDRIDLGSGNDCQVVIDDAAIAANQARLVRGSMTENYRMEPATPEPSIKVNGIDLSAPVEVADGTVFGIAEYLIKVDYLAGELAPLAHPLAESPEESLEFLSAEPESVWPAEPHLEKSPKAEVQIRPTSPVNLFVPLVGRPRSGKIPTWGWILAAAGIVLMMGILLLIAL